MLKKAFSKQNRALLSELVRTDFKLRYQGSVLGYLWSLLRPLLMFIILYIVFVKFLRVGNDIPNFPIYLLLGIVLWTFFADITSQSLASIVDRGDLIRKIRVPRWIIVLSSSISALINLGFNFIIVIVLMAINNVHFLKTSFLLPLIIIEIYIFALGIAFFLSAAFVKYRDVNYIWEVILQAGFYVTPILYPISIIKNLFYQKLILINPVAQSIQDSRYFLVTNKTQTINQIYGSSYIVLVPIMISLLIFILGVLYFKSQSTSFAENI